MGELGLGKLQMSDLSFRWVDHWVRCYLSELYWASCFWASCRRLSWGITISVNYPMYYILIHIIHITGDKCSVHYCPRQFQGCGDWEIKELDSTRRQEGRGCKNDSIHIKYIHLTNPCWVSVEKVDVQAVLRRRQHHRQGIHQARPRTA